MDDLLEVNKRLSMKVKLKNDMAAEYLDEIAYLGSVIVQLREERQQEISNVRDSSKLSPCRVDDSLSEDEEVALLTEKVNAREKRVAQLTEQLKAFEEVVAQNCEVSDNDDEVDSSALSDEVKRLKDEISMVKTTTEQEESKHRLRILELEEGRDSLRKDITELERQLKECLSELRDTQVHYEALKTQFNATRNERGNSAFAEIEDRRRRGEKLIARQREMICELKEDLQRSETENKRIFNEYMAEMRKKYFKRDAVNKLLAERERLLQENAKLTYELQSFEEMELDRNWETVKVARAFNLVDESCEKRVSTTVNRCKSLKQALNETVQSQMKSRQRLVDIALANRDLQDEIWHYTAMNSSLSSEIAELQSELASLQKENHCGNENADAVNSKPKRFRASDSDEIDKLYLRNQDLNKVETNKIESQGKEEENDSAKLSLRNDGDSTATTTPSSSSSSSSGSDGIVPVVEPTRIVPCEEVPQE
ncbi:unnamed protein product [Trichobilharzia szidati]|nr:unnamed protein product [Trichobilharzia szidati]